MQAAVHCVRDDRALLLPTTTAKYDFIARAMPSSVAENCHVALECSTTAEMATKVAMRLNAFASRILAESFVPIAFLLRVATHGKVTIAKTVKLQSYKTLTPSPPSGVSPTSIGGVACYLPSNIAPSG